tara:strand:- start:7223 stop:7489 length:267 start_codon:yes stop_codon:yes gene_type:complete
MTKYLVKYKYEFPVDEWDRPSGFYTLADVPIKEMKVLERTGEIIAKNIEHKMLKIKDDDNLAMSVWVKADDVEILNPDNYTKNDMWIL